MSELLLDAGNTRVKWALSGDAGLERVGAVAHGAADWQHTLRRAWRELEPPASAWIACVAGAAIADGLRAVLDASFPGARIELVRSAAELAGVRNGYAQPEQLGIDRLLALAGAHAAGRAPAIVVGVGTAATIDALAAGGEHRGGLILPSPAAMQAAVVAGTQVRVAHAGRIEAFARSTEDGLASGAWLALASCVERSAVTLAREVGASPAIVLHGGGAAALATMLPATAELREHLVLEGLAAVARGSVG